MSIYLQQAEKIYLADSKRFVGKKVKTVGEFETAIEAAAEIRKLKAQHPDLVFYTSSKPCKNWRNDNDHNS